MPKFGTRGGGQGVSLRCCYGRNFQVITPLDNQKILFFIYPPVDLISGIRQHTKETPWGVGHRTMFPNHRPENSKARERTLLHT